MTEKTVGQEEIITSIQKSQEEKSKQFRELVKNNPNKRLYQQRLIIQWAEVIDINKDDLKYVDNAEDKKYNQELMKKVSTDYGFEALSIAKSIQDNEKFSIEEFDYSGREYSTHGECQENEVNIHAMNLNDIPTELREALKSMAQKIKTPQPSA